MNPREAELDQSLEEKKLVIFGRDVSKIPCFRTSWLYGISGGLGMGILTFMFTSKTRLSGHVVVGSTCGITMVIFSACRYRFAKDEYLANQMKSILNEPKRLVGVDREIAIEKAQSLLNRDD